MEKSDCITVIIRYDDLRWLGFLLFPTI